MSGFFAVGQYWDVSKKDSDAVKGGAERLAVAGIQDALKEARLLWVATMPRRYEDYPRAFDDARITQYLELVDRRAAREPLSHLVGYRDFYKGRFTVGPAVLDPRPETEVLVEEALKTEFQRVLDVGVGSGAILISLLMERPHAEGVGIDLSPDAVAISRKNAELHELNHRSQFTVSDWFEQVNGQFDLIVSNPPYIAADEMDALQPEVRLYEPRMALTDEADGLTAYRIITAGAPHHLTPGGRLIVEIGPTQAGAATDLFAAAGFEGIRVVPDLDGRDRVVVGHWR